MKINTHGKKNYDDGKTVISLKNNNKIILII